LHREWRSCEGREERSAPFCLLRSLKDGCAQRGQNPLVKLDSPQCSGQFDLPWWLVHSRVEKSHVRACNFAEEMGMGK
jgi:hypothetical protein